MKQGSERRDLRKLLKLYEEWGFQMHQCLNFPSLIEKIEKFSGSGKIHSWVDRRLDYRQRGEPDSEDEKREFAAHLVAPAAGGGGEGASGGPSQARPNANAPPAAPPNQQPMEEEWPPEQSHHADMDEMDDLVRDMFFDDEPAPAPKPKPAAASGAPKSEEVMRKFIADKRLAAMKKLEERRKARAAAMEMG